MEGAVNCSHALRSRDHAINNSSFPDLHCGVGIKTSKKRWLRDSTTMKTSTMRRWAALGAIGYVLGASNVQGDSACTTLTDTDNPFVTSIFKMFGRDSDFISALPVSTMFGEINSTLPWLSTCMGSIDVITLAAATELSSALRTCLRDTEAAIDMSEDVELNSRLFDSLCPLYQRQFITCAKSAVNEILYFNMKNTDGCCDAFLDKFVELFSDPIDVMAEKLMKFLGNVICSRRTFTNVLGYNATETCGYSIINAFTNFDSADMIDLIQIPNAALCDAVEGKSFTNTKGGTSQFSFNLYGIDSMGICVQPVDALLAYLRTWPILQQTLTYDTGSFALTNLFEDDKIVPLDELLAWLVGENNLPMVIARTIDKVFNALDGDDSGSSVGSTTLWGEDGIDSESMLRIVASDITSEVGIGALHLPNSANCQFDSQTIRSPFSAASMTSMSAAVSVWSVGTSAFVSLAMVLLASAMTFA